MTEGQDRQPLVLQIEHPEEVFRFLAQNTTLVGIIEEAISVLRGVFRADAPLFLERIQDEETGEEELFLLVQVDMEPEEALQKLHQFDEEWFLDQQESIGGLFNV
ncbi:MAG: hypothetical protein D6681_00385, partial [Calditrichaeota bacterium]